MRKPTSLVALIAVLFLGWLLNAAFQSSGQASPGDDVLAAAMRAQQSGVQVTGSGTVTRVLADDDDGSRHQRFILTLETGETLLVAHNVDLTPRVKSIKLGDTITFNGVYEWNSKGSVVHWTHHDPEGDHVPGWIKHNGRTFQ